MTQTSARPAPAGRTRATYRLADLGVAPENMRFEEPADDEIPLLAATIQAAGLMQPLTVRPGRRNEKPAMALDGRRRLLALQRLLEQGAITDDFLVDVFEEIDPARQAAAVLLTNTAVPVHVADVIGAIGKMLKARLEVSAIAAALGYGEVDVRRLAALSGLPPPALKALKAGKLNLRQAKLLARIGEPEVHAEIAEAALGGYGFPEHRVNAALDEGRATLSDRRFALVGPVRYAAAGGRIEADLFGERPDVLLDPDLLDGLWIERAQALGARMGRADVIIHATSEPDPAWPADLESFGYDYTAQLSEAELAELEALQAAQTTAAAALAGLDAGDEAADEALAAYLNARLAAEQAYEPQRPVTLVMLSPSRHHVIELQAFAPAAPVETAEVDDGADAHVSVEPAAGDEPRLAAAPAVDPDVEGVNHALHEVRTDLATRALIRAVADHPRTALTMLIARLFAVEVLHQLGRGEGASTIAAVAYGRPRARVVEELDGAVRQSLADRRTVWRESGLSLIAWIEALSDEARMSCLAELAALSLDLREERTTSIRRLARAEAAELAGLCGAEVAAYWTPDDTFLRAHPKPLLLAMLEAMGEPVDTARSLKKEELVASVAEAAARLNWAPAYLSWRPEADDVEAVDQPQSDAAGRKAGLAA